MCVHYKSKIHALIIALQRRKMSNNAINTIDKIIHLLQELKDQIPNTSHIPLPVVKPTEVKPLAETAITAPVTPEDLSTFAALKTALLSDKWPEAVNPHLICNPESHDDKVERGRG